MDDRYETRRLAADIMTGLLFIIGSICMFYESLSHLARSLYLAGSCMMLVKALVNLAYRFRRKKSR
ncbi:YrhK family protein [Paenibacillus sp. CAA11]|uniref:YrhK family protein n=1 Tax=Paenibacillus sp. CAA11 TaxID=1532905 RepID=UPI00131EF65F|nr:YrhK family protein [Paenibacillus sp. CAA11]